MMFRGTVVSDEGLETHVAIKKFHHIFSEDTSKHVFEDLNGRLLRHRNLLCPFSMDGSFSFLLLLLARLHDLNAFSALCNKSSDFVLAAGSLDTNQIMLQ
uniref:Uncharacterized protein n=1 Tax=Arundo donax TaxID=35708 RepID=A0A0A9GQ34_ARUDO